MKLYRLFLLLIGTLFYNFSNISAQAPGCPSVNAGSDVNLACGGCTNLTATPFHVGATTSYNATSVPYAPPYPFNAGTAIFVGQDDIWSGVINLPFDFCFFGNAYNQIVVGANGLISFNTALANQYCTWSFSASLPNSTLYTNSIFGAYHDIDPSVCGNIRYAILGSYPCRTFVVNYDAVCHYSCNSLKTTQQIVLYETTNVIEVYIQNKPTCGSWNSGNALIGIQDATGANASWPPGYNTGPWVVSNMGFRFTPDGPPAYTLEWYEGANLIATNTPTINVCPGSNTMYTAKVTYSGCNLSNPVVVTDDVWVNVTGIPTGANSNSPLCEGQTLQLQSQGGYVSYQWSGPGGFTSNQQNPSIPNANASNAGVYTVTVNDGTGSCSSTITVQINPYPNATATNNGPACVGDNITFTATGGTSYAWSGPNGFSSTASDTTLTNVTTGASGVYTVTVTSNGCSSTATTSLTVNTIPTPTITGSNTICSGASTTLMASGGSSYAWSTGESTASISVSPTTNTVYTVTVSNGSCSGTATVSITVNPAPTPVVDGNNPVCNGDSIQITASGGTGYIWNTGANSAAINVPAGTYTVTVSDASTCTASTTVTVSLTPDPATSFTASIACLGAATSFTNTSTISLGTITDYLWNFGGSNTSTDENPTFIFTSSGTHTVTLTATSDNNCKFTYSTQIVVGKGPDISMQLVALCFAQLQALAISNDTADHVELWTWDFGDGNGDTGKIVTYPYTTQGTYTVTLIGTNQYGCDSTITQSFTTKGGKTLDQVTIANVLSPNGDNLNDELIMDPEFEECSPYTLTIFNRWGFKVFESVNNDPPFNGVSNTGVSIVPGVYFLVIRSNDLSYNGTITVVAN
ncbi:MAG: PKD domain-containing protein [Flavobacteriales bacterium]|nr:PKD domain-containing protein [Flavobacteriales bacterium]